MKLIDKIIEKLYFKRFPERNPKSFSVAEEARPQGKWIVDEDAFSKDFRKCSNCNEAEWFEGGWQFLSNFCPNCGADMRGEENEDSN